LLLKLQHQWYAKAVSTATQRFPDDVMLALHNANVTVTCTPVQIDHGEWQAALFFVLAENASCLNQGQLIGAGPYTVAFDADLHEHENATVIELGIEIATPPESENGTILFITGHSSHHFDVLKLLTQQDELPLFIGNAYCEVLSQQRVPLSQALKNGLNGLLDEAVRRDALIRMTGHYDPDAAFSAVLTHRGMTA